MSKEKYPSTIKTEDLEHILGDDELGMFMCFVDPNTEAEVFPIESQTDGDVLKIWYNNNQVLELTAKWTVMESQDERSN